MNNGEQEAIRLLLCSFSEVLQRFLFYEHIVFEASIFVHIFFKPFVYKLLSKQHNGFLMFYKTFATGRHD